jgi:hypothetical protein
MDLVGTSPRSQRDRTRREDRHLKFYELRDILMPRDRAAVDAVSALPH